MTRCRRLRAVAALLAVVIGVAPAKTRAQDPAVIDWQEVSQNWHNLSPAEQQRFITIAQGQPRPLASVLTPADQCSGATLETGPFPYMDNGSNLGLADDYVVTAAACPGTLNGITGLLGADIAYAFQVDQACTLQVDLTHSGCAGGFLASAYVVTDCSDITNTCIAGDDELLGCGISFSFAAVPGTTYFVISDATLSAGGHTFTLGVSDPAGAGCSLVPVELESFEID